MPKLDRNPETIAYREPDPRADGGTRTVRLSPRGVRIDRALSGMKMRLAVPIDAYRGVVLSREDRLQQRFYRVTLLHADEDLSITLSRATDVSALIDQWSSWARFFAKPALLDAEIGVETDKRRRTRRPGRHRTRTRPRHRARCLGSATKIFFASHELFSRE
jgi:hypothetical protein